MKFFITAIFFCISCIFSYANSAKFAIISSDIYNITENATLKGAKDYASRASVRYQTPIDVSIEKLRSLDTLKEQILYYKKQGYKGIILSLDSYPADFDDFLAQNCDDSFSIALINPTSHFPHALVSIKSDRGKELELIASYAKKMSGNFSAKCIYLFNAPSFEEIDASKALEIMSQTFSKEEFSTLLESTKDNDFFLDTNIASLFKNKGTYIHRQDSYGIILTNRQLLNGLQGLSLDKDRRFLLCLESSPMTISYMDSKILTATVVQDFFGFGFLSIKALIEKSLENITPSEKLQKLSPNLYTQESLDELKQLYISWLE